MIQRTVLLYAVGIGLAWCLGGVAGWLVLTLGASDWFATLAGMVAGGFVAWRMWRWHEHCDRVEQEARESTR